MSQKRTRSSVFIVTETTFEDDYKSRGNDWASSEATAFSTEDSAQKYARKCYRRALRNRSRGCDYADTSTSEFAVLARKRDAFLAKKCPAVSFFEWASEAEDLLQGEFVRCTFSADVTEQEVYDECSDSEYEKEEEEPTSASSSSEEDEDDDEDEEEEDDDSETSYPP